MCFIQHGYTSLPRTIPRIHLKITSKEIKLYKSMGARQRAGVNAIHAACLLEYGLKATKKSLDVILEAIKNNEHEGHWHYLKGQILRYERLSTVNPLRYFLRNSKVLKWPIFYDEHVPSHCIGLQLVFMTQLKM